MLSSNSYLLKNVRCCCQIIKRGIIVTAKAINSSDSSSICENVLGTSSDIIKRVIENAKTASLKLTLARRFGMRTSRFCVTQAMFWLPKTLLASAPPGLSAIISTWPELPNWCCRKNRRQGLGVRIQPFP